MAPFETEVLATPEAITALTEQVLAFLADQQVDARATHHVALVVEELVTNLGSHGNCRDAPATVRLVVEPAQVTGEIRDSGPPFDPRLAPDPGVDAPIEDRPIGGLGLYLVRELSTALTYAHEDGRNVTRFAITRS
jgi:anti-sigma regulatory factor (Ser/Thr protein kinase)